MVGMGPDVTKKKFRARADSVHNICQVRKPLGFVLMPQAS